MGEQSTGDSGTAYAEEIDYLAKQRKRKQEERAMRLQEEETGKSLFARSESGNIIRSASSRSAVTNRAGRQAQEDYRAAYEGRESRDMDAEFPMGDESEVSMQTGGQNKLEPKKTIKGPSAATRRLLAQGQVSQKTRQFY
tara:strand:+ start:350 stop:769 length:420 start_codon:yes stop_codon:yes gene_type:complete